MAGHTCPEIYHFQSGTLAFFLLLVDEMQFWGRPTFDKMFDNFNPPVVLLGPDFSKKNWQFTIRLPVAETGGGKQLFLSKASMFKKVLRTAADFHRRDFTLDLRIEEQVGGREGFSYRIVRTDQGAESFGVHPLNNDLRRKIEKLIIDQEPGAHEILEDTEITKLLKSDSRP